VTRKSDQSIVIDALDKRLPVKAGFGNSGLDGDSYSCTPNQTIAKVVLWQEEAIAVFCLWRESESGSM